MVAADATTINAVRAVAVRRPFAVPVAAAGNDGVGIASLAAGAGMQGMPLLRAGGLNRASFISMSQCRQLRIGGVVAAGAGVVILPTNFGAGGSLADLVNRVMSQCRHLRIGGIVAAGAGIVGFPADFCTGRRLRFVMHQIVIVWICIAALNNFTLVEARPTAYRILSRRYAGGYRERRFFE